MDLSKLSMPKLIELKSLLNLNDDELEVFNMLSKGKTITQTSVFMGVSESTVSRNIKRIKNKIKQLKERGDYTD